MPIALAAAGLLAGVRAETRIDTHVLRYTAILSVLAILSVGWWHYTDSRHAGALRPAWEERTPAALIRRYRAAAKLHR